MDLPYIQFETCVDYGPDSVSGCETYDEAMEIVAKFQALAKKLKTTRYVEEYDG